MKRTIEFGLSLLCLLATFGPAHAGDIPEKVQKALAGQILVTPRPLSEMHLESSQTAAALQKAHQHTLTQEPGGDGAPTWKFYFTAFLAKAPGVTILSMDFYTDDKERMYVANKRFGVDPGVLVISGRMALSEDDGLARDRRYIVRLTAQVKGRDVVLATTKLTTK